MFDLQKYRALTVDGSGEIRQLLLGTPSLKLVKDPCYNVEDIRPLRAIFTECHDTKFNELGFIFFKLHIPVHDFYKYCSLLESTN